MIKSPDLSSFQSSSSDLGWQDQRTKKFSSDNIVSPVHPTPYLQIIAENETIRRRLFRISRANLHLLFVAKEKGGKEMEENLFFWGVDRMKIISRTMPTGRLDL